MLDIVVAAIVILSTIWTISDAHANRVPQLGQKEYTANDPWIWGICSLLLWIVVFPAYLIKRAVYAARKEVRQIACNTPLLVNADEILKLRQLLDCQAITQEEYETAKARLLGTNSTRSAGTNFIQMQ